MPAELIKICSSSKDESRDGLSMLTVPGADISGAIRWPAFSILI